MRSLCQACFKRRVTATTWPEQKGGLQAWAGERVVEEAYQPHTSDMSRLTCWSGFSHPESTYCAPETVVSLGRPEFKPTT